MNAKPLVLVHPPLGLFELQLGDYEVAHWPIESTEARARVRAAITIGHVGISNDMIAALPNLAAIICFGVGVDGIDLDTARERGIAITNGREINHEDVADVALGHIIATARSFTLGERVLREGRWTPPLAVPPQRRLRGMKLGVVGMGAIGQAIAARAQAFGMEIKWFGPRAKPEVALAYEPSLQTLAEWADVLAIAARGDRSTENLVSAEIIKALGPQGILVNVSRGSVVDEDALIAALKSGALGAAGLDVFREEPTPASRWADVPNCTLTPHLGGGTREALYAGSQNVLANLRAFLAGQPLVTPLI